MTLRNKHTLISAYAALATIAAGLLVYGATRPETKEPAFGELTIESVASPEADRTDSQSVAGTPKTAAR
jgi:hypothetical protein